jgi:hypothetical protein
MPILRILCYNGSVVTWTVVSLTTAKFKPLVFSVPGFVLSYAANMFILMVLCDFCLFPAQFCYIIVYTRKVENRVQITTGVHLRKFPLARGTLFCNRCNFKRSYRISGRSQNYVTTDGQSASLSRCQAPIWDLRQLGVCWGGAPSLRRGRVCRLQCTIYKVQ